MKFNFLGDVGWWFLLYSDGGISVYVYDFLLDLIGDNVWMIKGSLVYEVLRKIVLDKCFLNNIYYYLNFR